MSKETSAPRRPTLWLVLGGILAAVGTGLLWPLREVGQVCIEIYPQPPGCGAEEPLWVPLVGIAAVVALFCTMVVFYFTRPAPRFALILLSAGIVVAVALAAAVVALSQTGVWDPGYPTVIID